MLNDASSSIATRTSEISSQTELLRQAQSEFVWQIESKLDGFEKRQESLLQENRELVEEQMEGFAKCLEEIAEGEKGFRGDSREFREVVEKTCRGLFEKIERRTNEVEREQRELANRLNDELQKHSLEVSGNLSISMYVLRCSDKIRQYRRVPCYKLYSNRFKRCTLNVLLDSNKIDSPSVLSLSKISKRSLLRYVSNFCSTTYPTDRVFSSITERIPERTRFNPRILL